MSLNKIFSQSIVWRLFYVVTVLLQNVFFSRYFQAENSGWIYYLTNVLGLVIIICSLSLDSGFTFFTANGEIEKPRIQLFAMIWVVVISLIGLATSGYFILQIDHTYPLTSSLLLFFCVIYVSGMVFNNYLLAMFYAVSNFFLPNLIIGITNIVIVVFIPKSVHLVNANESLVLKLYFLLPAIQSGLLLVFYTLKYQTYKNVSFPTRKQVDKIVRFSFVALSANIIFFLINRADYYFVQKYCDKNDVGNYILVSRLGQMLLIIPQVLASVVFPQIAKGDYKKEIINTIVFLTRILSRLYLIFLILVVLLGKFAFTMIFGNTFSSMHIYFSLFIPGLFALSVLSLVSAVFLGEGRVRVNFYGTLMGLLVLIVGDFLIVPRFGAEGAAIISSLAYIVNASFSLSQLKRYHDVNFRHILLWKKEELIWMKSFLYRK